MSDLHPEDVLSLALIDSYDLNNIDEFSADFITNPNIKIAVINSQIVNVTKNYSRAI